MKSFTLTGKQALQTQLQKQGFTLDDEIWIKVNNNIIYCGEITPDGFELWKCKQKRDNQGNPIEDPKGGSVWVKNKHYPDGYKHLRQRSEQGDEIFFIPNHPIGGIGAGHCSRFNKIFAECDDRPITLQWDLLQETAETLHIVPSTVIYSGGKSLHIYYQLSFDISREQWQMLQRKLIIIFKSDKAIQNPNREMRLAGFARTKKGTEQTLDKVTSATYSFDELNRALDKSGKFPYGLSDTRWSDWRIHGDEVLTLPEDELPTNIQRAKQYAKQSQKRQVTGFLGSNNLVDLINETSERLGEDAFNWPGHNWKTRGNKSRGCCPWHDSQTKTSGWIAPMKNSTGWGYACPTCTDNKQIDAFTYWLGLRKGSLGYFPSGKEWVELAKEFLAEFGVTTPELEQKQFNNYGEPESELYREYVEREQEQERIDDYLTLLSFKKSFKQIASKVVKPIQKIFTGFGEAPKEPQKQSNQAANVDICSSYQDINANVNIWFSSQDRDKIYQEIATDEKYQNYKYILDKSGAGSGKSHYAGTLEPSNLKAAKLWYISSDHRNPTTSTIEKNYVDLPVRNDGLYADPTQLTPNGNPKVHWPEKGQVPNVKGNCARAPLFRKLASKGYQIEANSEASLNPICNTCRYKFNCSGHFPDGKEAAYIPGNTFRQDRKNALLADRIRCHINSLPSDIPDDSIAFVDEFPRQINSIQLTEVGLNDYEQPITTIATELPEAWELIKDFISPLHEYLPYSHKEAYYGYSHQEVMQIFGNIDKSKIVDIINKLKILNPDLEEIFEDTDGLDNYAGMSKGLIRTLKTGFLREAAKHSHEMLDDLAVNWLIPLLEIYAGLVPGNFRIKNHKLIIATKNTRQVELLDKFKKVFLLDATANRESVALELGINPDEILVISENLPNYSNLKIVHIADLGLCGKNRGEFKHTQIAALTKHLQSKHDRLGVIDHLACVEDGQGYWYVDNRGSNKYVNVDALLCIGTPYPDLGAIAQKYSILTGDFDTSKDNPNFQKYVDHLVQAEIIQAVGRPRSNRRPEQKITVYLTANTDVSYISNYYPECTIEVTEACNLTPEAGGKVQRLRYAIVQAAKQIWETGEKITQKAIASLVGVTQGRISQEAAEMGGWTALKKILIFLLDSLYSKINNFSAPLSENQQFYVEQFLPLLAGEERLDPADVATTLDDIGDEAEVKLVLSRVPFETKLLLIIKLLAHVPDEFVEIITPLIPRELLFEDGS